MAEAAGSGELENVIILSEAFCRDQFSSDTVERDVVAALANAPGVLEFYMWLVRRNWTMKAGRISVPLVAERGLNEQLGSTEYTEPRFFRAKVRLWLRQVQALWPQCPAFISPDGLSIQIQSSRANPAIPTVTQAVNH